MVPYLNDLNCPIFSLIFSKFWKGFRTLYHVADRDLRENNDEIFSVNHSDMCQKVVQYLDPRGASDHFIQRRCSAGEADSNPKISEVVESITPKYLHLEDVSFFCIFITVFYIILQHFIFQNDSAATS